MTKSWTFMVYMAGDNNLEQFGFTDLEEMKSAGSSDQVEILAQFDGTSTGGARRYRLTADGPLENDIVEEIGPSNTGDPAGLIDFVEWGTSNYPAERVALVLWNHGAGWKDDDIYARAKQAGIPDSELPRSLIRGVSAKPLGRSLFATSVQRVLAYPASIRAILFDDTSKDFLDNQELKQVLDAVKACRGGRKSRPDRLRRLPYEHGRGCLPGEQTGAAAWSAHRRRSPATAGPTTGCWARWSKTPRSPPSSSAHSSSTSLRPATRTSPGAGNPVGSAAGGGRGACRVDRPGGPASLMDRMGDRAFGEMCSCLQCGRFRCSGTASTSTWPPAEPCWGRPGQRRGKTGAALMRSVNNGCWAPTCRTNMDMAQGLSIYLPQIGKLSPAYGGLELAQACCWGDFLTAFAAG